MARFCGNCGKQLEDDERFCSECGTAFEEVPVVPPMNEYKPKPLDPAQKKKIKLAIIGGATVFGLLIAGILAFNIVSKFTGYNGFLRKVMKAYEEYDIDALVDMSGDMYYYGDEESVVYYFKNNVGNSLEEFENNVGNKYKFSYKVKDSYPMTKRQFNETLENIEYQYPDFDTDDIDKIVVAEVVITAKQGKKTQDKTIRVTMSKEGKSWKLLYLD